MKTRWTLAKWLSKKDSRQCLFDGITVFFGAFLFLIGMLTILHLGKILLGLLIVLGGLWMFRGIDG